MDLTTLCRRRPLLKRSGWAFASGFGARREIRGGILGVLLAAGCVVAGPALAQEPLYVKNLSPVSGLLGLPSQRLADTSPVGTLNLAFHASVANNYVAEVRNAETVNLDGETLRLALELRYAFADDWDVQLEVPWLDHSEGQLDSLIDNWHDFWGMSDGGRSDVPRDLLDIRYEGNGAFALEDEVSGIGDTSLSLNYRFFHDASSVASIALGYKFGTGEEGEFLGSGADDAFLVVRFSGDHQADLPLRWHGQLGYLRAGNSDLLGDAQERDLWFAGLSLDWVLSPRWSLLAQVDSHAAPMDSGLTALGDEAVMLSGGVRWTFARAWALDFTVIEDVMVETAPDVTFQASLRYRPR